MKKIYLGSDKYGYHLKEAVKKHLEDQKGFEIHDVGCTSPDDDTPYYTNAVKVAKEISKDSKKNTYGILCCGTGMGMSIIANKFPGVYASVCESLFAASKCRAINNSNVLTMGEFITAPVLATAIVDTWLETRFATGFDATITKLIEKASKDIQKIEKEVYGK